jgi:hypothetical protein
MEACKVACALCMYGGGGGRLSDGVKWLQRRKHSHFPKHLLMQI